jgi:hypothetical protein
VRIACQWCHRRSGESFHKPVLWFYVFCNAIL